MTEIEIRQAAGELHDAVVKMTTTDPPEEAEQARVVKVVLNSSEALLTQLLVDVHRIADALDVIARCQNEIAEQI